jgi:hypothetical protein
MSPEPPLALHIPRYLNLDHDRELETTKEQDSVRATIGIVSQRREEIVGSLQVSVMIEKQNPIW